MFKTVLAVEDIEQEIVLIDDYTGATVCMG